MQLTASNVRIIAVVLTALCAVSGGIYLVFCKRKDYRRAFTYKGTAGLCFVVLGLLGPDANIRSLLGVAEPPRRARGSLRRGSSSVCSAISCLRCALSA